MIKRFCDNPACGIEKNKNELKRCSGCKKTFYCSIKCHIEHWKSGHKKECRGRKRTKQTEKVVENRRDNNGDRQRSIQPDITNPKSPSFGAAVEKGKQLFNERLEPNSPYKKGEMLVQQPIVTPQMRKDAIEHFSTQLRISNDPLITFNSRYLRGACYFELGEYDKAITDYDFVLKIIPEFFEVLLHRGLCYYHKRLYSLSMKDYNRALGIRKGEFRLHLNRSNCLVKMKEPRKALVEIEEAIRLCPENPRLYELRGKILLFDFENLSSAIVDFTKSIDIDNNNYYAFFWRGLTFRMLKKYDKALRDFLNFSNFHKCEEVMKFSRKAYIGEMYSKLGKYDESEDIFNKYLHFSHFEWEKKSKDFQHMRQLDIDRFVQMHCDRALWESASDEPNIFDLNSVYGREMNKMQQEKDRIHRLTWYTFLKDNGVAMGGSKTNNDFTRERELHELYQGVLRKLSWNCLVPLRKLGRGAYAQTFLCEVRGAGLFAVKFMKFECTDEKEREKRLKLENISLSTYHRNIVTILGVWYEKNFLVDELRRMFESIGSVSSEEKFLSGVVPDVTQGESSAESSNQETTVPLAVVFMMYHRKDLSMYLKERVDDNVPFHNFELCNLLIGILRGVAHLNDCGIVHRDLHAGNLFIDEMYGRVWIGDYGAALDLRDSKTGFRIRKDDEKLHAFYSGSYIERGGGKEFLPPEVVDFQYDGEDEYLDYSKSDIFSVGMIGYHIVMSFFEDPVAPFGIVVLEPNSPGELHPKVSHRKQVDFIPHHILLAKNCHVDIANFIASLLTVDFKKRPGSKESLEIFKTVSSSVVIKERITGPMSDFFGKIFQSRNKV